MSLFCNAIVMTILLLDNFTFTGGFMQNDMPAMDNGLPDLGTHPDFAFEQPEQNGLNNWFDTDL